jgi:hypothetical protein
MVLIKRLLTAAVMVAAIAAGACDERRTVEAGFWFDEVSFEADALGGALTAADLRLIEAMARKELAAAFHGLNISITDRRDARYHVRVVKSCSTAGCGASVVAGQAQAMRALADPARSLPFASGA